MQITELTCLDTSLTPKDMHPTHSLFLQQKNEHHISINMIHSEEFYEGAKIKRLSRCTRALVFACAPPVYNRSRWIKIAGALSEGTLKDYSPRKMCTLARGQIANAAWEKSHTHTCRRTEIFHLGTRGISFGARRKKSGRSFERDLAINKSQPRAIFLLFSATLGTRRRRK